MAKSDVSRYPFAPQDQRELASVLANPDQSPFWKRIDVLDRADLILDRLRSDANNNPRARDSKPISLERVAEFLAAVSMNERADLAKTVKSGLRDLGITYQRPRNRKAETLYSECVDLLAKVVEHTGVFAKKSEIREKFGTKWRFEFRRLLGREGWPEECSDWLTSPKATPRTLAIYIASEIFGLSYDRIRRARLNCSKSVKK